MCPWTIHAPGTVGHPAKPSFSKALGPTLLQHPPWSLTPRCLSPKASLMLRTGSIMPCQSAICIRSRKPCVFRSSDMLVFPMGLSCHRFSLSALGQKRGALTPIISWALSSPYRSGPCVVKLVSDFASNSKILSQASKSLLSAWYLLPASMWS